MRRTTIASALAFAFTCGAALAEDSAHLLVAAQGKVTLKRPGWTASASAAAGTVLRRGDLLFVPNPGRATVACADLSVHELPAGRVSGVPCASAEKGTLVYEGSLLIPTRGEAGENVPVVIAPRRTKLLSARPTLRWAPMAGVTAFTVSVRGPNVNWTKEVSGATSVAYPDDAAELAPEATYKVTVTAGGHSSDELSEPNLGFTILGTKDAGDLRAEVERIRALGLSGDAARLLTAHVYASRGLNAEAIEQLEVIAKSSPAPQVSRMLGALYQAVGLNRLAEERYLQAAKQSLEAEDIEGQALAQRALGVLYQDAFGLEADATRAFKAALALFEKLGDADAVKQMKEKLAPRAQTEELTKEQADKLTLDSVALYRSGDSAGALATLDRVLGFYRRTGDRESEGDVLYARGVILSKKDTAKALEAFKESLAIARALESDETQVLRDMAMTMLDARMYAEAGQAFEEERAIHARTKDRKAEGEAVYNLGFVASAQRRDAEALPLLEQALAIRREVGDREGEARTLESAALLYNRADRKQTALDALEKALPIWRELGETENADATRSRIAQLRASMKPSRPVTARQRAQSDQAHVLNTECAARMMAGDAAGALPRCERARALFAKAEDRGGEAMAVVNLGLAYFYLGEHTRSREISLQGLALAREAGAEETEANAYDHLALVDLGRAQFSRALTYLQRALAIWRNVHELAAEQRTLGNLAAAQAAMGLLGEAAETFEQLLPRQSGNDRTTTLINLGAVRGMQKNFTAARALIEEAIALERKRGDPLLRTSLSNLGAVHAELGEYAKALELFQESLALDRKAGDRASECGDLLNIAGTHALQNEPAKALELYQQALTGIREIGSSPNEAIALAGIGRVYESQGKLQQALDTDRQVIALQETIRAGGQTEEIKTALAERAAEVYERAFRLLVRLGHPDEAFDFAERARGRTFLDQLGNTGIELRAGGSEKEIEQERLARLAVAGTNRLLEQEKAKPRAEQNAERIQALSNQLAAKRREYADVMTRLKLSNAEYASLVTVAPLKLAEVQQLLQPDTTLLSYFVTADATTAFIVTRETFKAVELPVSEKDLRAAVEELRAFAGVGGPPSPALARLSAALIEPVLPSLRTPLVGIVPHGVLHLLPFAALRGKEPGSWLGQDYTLFHLPSASALPFIQQKRKTARGELLALAQGQPAGLPALRYAEKEAEAVAALFGVKALTGRAATETALRERAAGAGIVHLAAHGQLNAAAPLFSRLVLAPDDDLDTARDGSLEVREIYGLDLKKASLVVLSACQTQLGAQSKGDDVVGLSRAFIYAGSPAVLASLWSVDDAATAALMMAFYRHIREGAGAAAALRAAQAETREKYPDPYYWASFVLTGDPR